MLRTNRPQSLSLRRMLSLAFQKKAQNHASGCNSPVIFVKWARRFSEEQESCNKPGESMDPHSSATYFLYSGAIYRPGHLICKRWGNPSRISLYA